MKSEAEVQFQVREILNRFNELASKRNLHILEEFVPDNSVLLVGSDAGKVAKGIKQIEEFFIRIFAGNVTFSWEWDRIDVSHTDNLLWLFTEGWVIISTSKEQQRSPYRITGILELRDERWLWRHYHGSEPVIDK